jgi:hypothetical protein
MDHVLAGLMGDHLALIVDRLLIESTLEAAIGGGKHMVDLCQETMDVEYFHRGLGGGSVTKVVECRICQEEDWDTCMEAPCTCCGSLKVPDLFNHAIFYLGPK